MKDDDMKEWWGRWKDSEEGENEDCVLVKEKSKARGGHQ